MIEKGGGGTLTLHGSRDHLGRIGFRVVARNALRALVVIAIYRSAAQASGDIWVLCARRLTILIESRDEMILTARERRKKRTVTSVKTWLHSVSQGVGRLVPVWNDGN
jgi:hypothetical protein